VVEILIVRYVIGARIKAVRGDRDAAAKRLDDGAHVAATLGLPRLRAYVENERMRLDLPVAASPRQVDHENALLDGGLGEITAQLRDEAEIRGLLADQPALACDRAQAWVHRLEHQRRPRALLQANRILVACLSAAGRTDEAKKTLAHIAAQCAERGMIRYLLDGGPRVVALLVELRDDLRSGRWEPIWPPIPPAFLDNILSEAHSVSSGTAAQP
jgi:serine/threonine-protein kinase PknK